MEKLHIHYYDESMTSLLPYSHSSIILIPTTHLQYGFESESSEPSLTVDGKNSFRKSGLSITPENQGYVTGVRLRNVRHACMIASVFMLGLDTVHCLTMFLHECHAILVSMTHI